MPQIVSMNRTFLAFPRQKKFIIRCVMNRSLQKKENKLHVGLTHMCLTSFCLIYKSLQIDIIKNVGQKLQATFGWHMN